MGNNGSTAEKRAKATQFKKWTKCEQATIVIMWLLAALLGVTSITAIIMAGILYDTGDDANKAMSDLMTGLNSINAVGGDCFTCDIKTGNIKFNSTLNIERTRITSDTQFYVSGQAGVGLNLPGYSFMNSPLSTAIDGAPMVTGDIVFAPNSGLNQDGLDELVVEPAGSPPGYMFAQQNPSPMGFGPSIIVNDGVQSATTISSIRIGTFTTGSPGSTSQSERCKAELITPSPTAYFVVDDSTSQMYLCVCISSQGGAVGSGSGEHCTSTFFETGLFPPIP